MRTIKYIAILLIFLLLVGLVAFWLSSAGQSSDAISLDLESFERALSGIYLNFRAEEINTPASTDNTPILFTIHPGETAATIAPRLWESGLIRDADLFRLLAVYRGVDVALQAGEYQLRASMTMDEILEIFRTGQVYAVTITIPEGWRSEEIAEYLESLGLVDAQDFLQRVAEGSFFRDFLIDQPDSATLEGYLFPDTYTFPPSTGADAIIELMLDNFGRRFTSQMRQMAQRQGMSIFEVVTLASLVEREAALVEERPLIAGVLLNRLKAGMSLEADATVQYALGYNPETGSWWNSLTGVDLRSVDSPYNTYLYLGLPPGPIATPGLASIMAVLEPTETPYYYYYANYLEGDGSHVFAETYEEHLENIARYGPQ